MSQCLARAGRSVRCKSAWREDDRRFAPRVQQHSCVETGHEIIFIIYLYDVAFESEIKPCIKKNDNTPVD